MYKITTYTLMFILCLCVYQTGASMYSWTDENGVKHYSNNPPPSNNKTKDLKVSDEIEYDASKDKKRLEKADEYWNKKLKHFNKSQTGKKKTRKKKYTSSKDVVMFSTRNCGYCTKAKAFFNQHGVKYTDIDINKSEDGRKRFKELNGRGVPLILIGDKKIRGFNKHAIKKELGL